MSELLADAVAVVTGGASGIGRGIATTMARHGANVVVADVRETPREGGEPTHAHIEAETDAEACFVECDVTETDALQRAADAAVAMPGDFSAWVNNAGVSGEPDYDEVTPGEFDRIMGVNAKAAFFGTRVAAERMGAGSVVNLSSLAGLIGYAAIPVYAMSKGAVALLTYSMAAALAPDVRVNAIHPGAVHTAMSAVDDEMFEEGDPETHAEGIPLARIGTPEDIGNAAVFLASDLADYVTAQSIVVDGGIGNTR